MIGLVLLAAVIRLPTLSQQSFWLDEGYTIRLLRMGFGSMLSTIPKTESTPPVYYALAWVWTHVFGLTEYGLRSLSALAGIATVPVVYAVARRLSGERAAVIAGTLVAVSPLMLWFSQEARAYALAALLAAVTLWCSVAYLEAGGWRWLAGWAAASAVGLATHYFVVFVVAPEVVLLWLGARRQTGSAPAALRRLGAAFTLVAVVVIALIPLGLAQRGTGHADYIAQGALTTRILQVPKQLVAGYASPALALTAALAAVVLAVGAVWPLIRSAAARGEARIPLIVGLAAVIVPILLALIGVDFLDTRNLLPALPALVVAAAIGFDHAGEVLGRARGAPASADGEPSRSKPGLGEHAGALLAVALVVVSVTIIVLVDSNPRYQRADWRGAARALGQPSGPRAVSIQPGPGLIPFAAYEPDFAPMNTPERISELDVIALPPEVSGGGLGTPPRPSPPPTPPPGFRLVGAIYADGYTVLRYRSPTAALLTPAQVAAVSAEPGGPSSAMFQSG